MDFMPYIYCFIVGGILCVIGQLLLDFTKMTPARILVTYVVSGVFLSAIGVWDCLVKFGGSGATVPLLGFGHLLAQGVKDAVDKNGLIGAITGGFGACAGGVTASLIIGFLMALVARSKDQN